MEIGGYVLIIEDDQGKVIARLSQSAKTAAPGIGYGTTVDDNDTPNGSLHGNYRVRDVILVSDPNPHHRVPQKVPYVYVRRSAQGDEPRTTRPDPEGVNRRGDPDTLDSAGDAPPDAELDACAEDFRELATELGEHRDELARMVRESNGQLDPELPKRVHEMSRRAKQRQTEILLRPRRAHRRGSTEE